MQPAKLIFNTQTSSVDTDEHHSENEGIIDDRLIDHDHLSLTILDVQNG